MDVSVEGAASHFDPDDGLLGVVVVPLICVQNDDFYGSNNTGACLVGDIRGESGHHGRPQGFILDIWIPKSGDVDPRHVEVRTEYDSENLWKSSSV